MVGDGGVLDRNALVRKKRKELNQVDLVQVHATAQLLRESCLGCQNLVDILYQLAYLEYDKGDFTMLLEKRVSSRFAERLIEENARIMSRNEL